VLESELDRFDACVIGAGVVGLAVAKALSEKFDSVVVLEKEKLIGSGVSSRNSEVIHAGIYYPTGYEFCETYQVPHRRIGKLIVATEEGQCDAMDKLKLKAEANGVLDLDYVSAASLTKLEPEVKGIAALFSPSTGIIDGHGLMTAYETCIEQNGGVLCLDSVFKSAELHGDDFIIDVESVGEAYRFKSPILINAAGLDAQQVSANIEFATRFSAPELYYCKGCYFSLSGRSPFNHLIYPMPEANTTGLGVHATIDLAGQVKFGPDTEYKSELEYSVPEAKRRKFAEAVRRYYPNLDEHKLAPAYAGVRPKIQGPGEAARDFEIEQPVPGLVHLFGIESPGLTASLAIGEHVANLFDSSF